MLAGAEALALGRGGVSAVARATGLSRSTVQRGMKDVQTGNFGSGRIRREGAGRRRLEVRNATLREDLKRLIEPTSRGDPQSPFRWTTKSVRRLAEELRARATA